MKCFIGIALAGLLSAANAVAATAPESVLDFSFRKLASKEQVSLQQAYAGQVLLIVNTASKCGNTPQYEGLEAMYGKYQARGFAVLGFPSNDFMGQEPGDEAQIAEFCTLTYGVKFPMFEKVQVRGNDAAPLFQMLAKQTGEAPGWNFHKYLIDRQGHVVASFAHRTQPDDARLVAAIEKLLASPQPK